MALGASTAWHTLFKCRERPECTQAGRAREEGDHAQGGGGSGGQEAELKFGGGCEAGEDKVSVLLGISKGMLGGRVGSLSGSYSWRGRKLR